jgi:hypothetical protein
LRIWTKVIFTGRSDIAHDSADRHCAQIINPLGQWMKPAYRTSRMWIID